MYLIKIKDEVKRTKIIKIKKGDYYLERNGDPVEEMFLNKDGSFQKENGKNKKRKKKKETDEIVEMIVDINSDQIDLDKKELVESKVREIESKIKKYKAAQKKQKASNGAGPVADFEVMKIVNEFDGKFSVEIE